MNHMGKGKGKKIFRKGKRRQGNNIIRQKEREKSEGRIQIERIVKTNIPSLNLLEQITQGGREVWPKPSSKSIIALGEKILLDRH